MGLDQEFFWETNNAFCRNDKLWEPGMNCYYERYSKCSVKDAGLNGDTNKFPAVSVGDLASSFDSDENRLKTMERFGQKLINVVFTHGNLKFDQQKMIPRDFFPLIECSPMKKFAHYFWWRIVSATFIARPNSRVLTKLNELAPKNLVKATNSCVSVHVRHGDKGIEMTLLPFSQYRDTAVHMWDKNLVPGGENNQNSTTQNSPSSLRSMFLSSEDVLVFKEAIEWGKSSGWKIYYTEVINREKSSSSWTHDQVVHSKGQHEDNEYLSYILNMRYSLQCEAFVCTLKSNTCRIMDELRATVGGKANRFFADLSSETCTHPPCFDGAHIVNYGE